MDIRMRKPYPDSLEPKTLLLKSIHSGHYFPVVYLYYTAYGLQVTIIYSYI